ncbi:serine-rich adhesin for platelets-like [Cebidichthys violaceus]|uniref:serine-rich adhesin for platelets-like n=1 Tax=Cebidichthys violaceus TaxID=271503 RepID=UPI0035CC9458
MLETSPLHSRLLFVCALACAAVMPFIMCSDAAGASPKKNQVDTGGRHIVLRRTHTPHSQHHPLFSGLPSLHTGANSETEKSGNYGGASSIIYHQSNPSRVTESSFGYKNNSPDSRQSRAVTTSVPSGMSSATSYRPLSYNSYPVFIKKTSYKQAASPFHQRSSPPEVWDAKEAHRSKKLKEKVPKNGSPSFFSSQTGRYRSTLRPTSRGLYSGYKETNERSSAGARRTSSGILSSKFFGLASQTAPRAPSVSSSSDASVIKSIPSPEKLTPSITGFSQGLYSASGSVTPRRKKMQSYLFKDSQTAFGGHGTVQTVPDEGPHKQRASKVTSRFASNAKRLQQSRRKDPTPNVRHLSDNANPLHHNNKGAHYGTQTDGFAKYQRTARVSAPGKDGIMGSNYAAGSSKSVVSSISDATTRGSTHASTSGQAIKNIYGFKRLENSKWRAAKEPPIPSFSGSNERINSGRSSFDKGKGSKITNTNRPLSPKYSFGQREASATRAKSERTPTEYSAPSPRAHQDLASRFKEARPRLPDSDAGVDSNPDHRRFRIHKRIYGFKAFGPGSLEGARTSVSEPNDSARVQQAFEGFKLRSPQFWQPKSSRINTMSRTEPGSEDHKPLLKTAESADSVSSVTPDESTKKHKIDSLLVFPPIQNRIENADDEAHKQNPESHRISLAYFRSAGEPDTESRPKSEPGTPDKTELFAKMASLLNSTVKGQAKTLNESAPINDTAKEATVRVAITCADILRRALFSSVTATTQTPTAPADKDDFPNTTTAAAAAAEQKEGAGNLTLNSQEAVRSGDNTSKGPEDIEENKMAVGSEDVDDDKKTSDFFLDNEGSGSGGFNVSDVLSTAATKSQGLSEDLSELEYLRISTGNISFKSMTLAHTEP